MKETESGRNKIRHLSRKAGLLLSAGTLALGAASSASARSSHAGKLPEKYKLLNEEARHIEARLGNQAIALYTMIKQAHSKDEDRQDQVETFAPNPGDSPAYEQLVINVNTNKSEVSGSDGIYHILGYFKANPNHTLSGNDLMEINIVEGGHSPTGFGLADMTLEHQAYNSWQYYAEFSKAGSSKPIEVANATNPGIVTFTSTQLENVGDQMSQVINDASNGDPTRYLQPLLPTVKLGGK
jgi:hypothetical protein